MQANAAQLIFSLMYFAYNGIFTTLSTAIEWSSFAATQKGVRRSRGSDLVGAQRASYFLQLPYRLALPLLVASGSLHWLISQSIFLVYFQGYMPTPDYDGTEKATTSSGWPVGEDIITCGWSPAAVLLTVLVGVLMLLFLIGFGLWRLPTAMPVAGSCSAAIAAACHPPPAECGERIWEKELRWGVTLEPDGEKPGHCSFSSKRVPSPIPGEKYL